VKIVSIEPTCMPSPTWRAFIPPCASCGRLAPWRSWAKPSLNVTRPDLNATVLTFAMLLPITSIRTW
jgi:hypothetical protein